MANHVRLNEKLALLHSFQSTNQIQSLLGIHWAKICNLFKKKKPIEKKNHIIYNLTMLY